MTFAPPVIPSVGHVGERSCMRVPDRSALAEVAGPRTGAIQPSRQAVDDHPTRALGSYSHALAHAAPEPATVNSP